MFLKPRLAGKLSILLLNLESTKRKGKLKPRSKAQLVYCMCLTLALRGILTWHGSNWKGILRSTG